MITSPLGDDVMGSDPTVALLEDTLAGMFQKESALFFPSGTMSNLCGIMSHCHGRGSEVRTGQALQRQRGKSEDTLFNNSS